MKKSKMKREAIKNPIIESFLYTTDFLQIIVSFYNRLRQGNLST